MIFPQGLENVFHADRVMRVIDQERVFAGHRHRLYAALDLNGAQPLLNLLLRHVKVAAHRNGGQSVVGAELSGNIHRYGEIQKAAQIKARTQIAGTGHKALVFRPELRLGRKAVGFQLAGVILYNALPVLIINIHNSQPALAKQHALARQIFL